jgi:glycolate oxidase
MAEAEKIMNVVEQFDIDEVLFADTKSKKNALWKMRSVAEAVKQIRFIKKNTVVPRYNYEY